MDERELAVAAAQTKFRRLLRVRTIMAVLLMLCGAALLYIGTSDGSPVFITFGIVFLIYSGFMQLRAWSAGRFVENVRRELDPTGPA